MDGLLHTEFALVLRDSLSSTPRRHVVCAPLSAPPPSKKRRLPEPCDHPSPQSPALPLAPQLALPSSPTPSFVSAESLQPQHGQTRLAPALHVQHPQLAKLQSTSHPSNAAAPVQSPTSVRGSIQGKTDAFSPSVYESVAPATPRPFSLDVLASVSAEQTQNETALVAPALSPITHPPRAVHAPPTQQAINTERLSLRMQPPSLSLPTTPVTPPPRRDLFAVPAPTKPAALRQVTGIKRIGRAAEFKNVRVRSFACTMCTSSFTERFNLNKHVRAVHERRRPFECPTCHARFQQRDHMQKHEMCVHKKLRQYLCVTCGASFGWRGVLKKHRKSVHNIVDS